MQVDRYLKKLLKALVKVHVVAVSLTFINQTLPSGEGAALGDQELMRQLRQLAVQLKVELDNCSATMPMDAVAVLRQRALPRAEAVAELLWQFWESPGRQNTAAVEMAQAAATRCCAYLGCAQLGQQGGPGAGEGVGSKRCSRCHVAWYCGTACSHADWRAGHSKMCKVLAALKASGTD
jgi:hypothetical protein